MTEENNFLEALRARPDDTTLRLVYADWLEERGNVRGTFIRLMEEMRTLPIYSDRFAELRPRHNELRGQIEPQWIEQLGYVPVYRPMFTKIPPRRIERWRLIEEFVGRLHGIHARVCGDSRKIDTN